MVSPEEYESLPPSIQKKYFSSVERLRIAQQSAAEKRKKHPQSQRHDIAPSETSWLSMDPSTDSSRPRTAHVFKPSISSISKIAMPSRPRRSEADVNEEQALRFLSLPDKVKRSHFTPEELVLLTESSERALGSLSGLSEDIFQRRSTFDRKRSVCSSQYRSSTSEDYDDDVEKAGYEVDFESVRSYDTTGGKDMDNMKMQPRTRQGSVASSFSTMSHHPATSVWRNPSERSRSGSFSRRRALSLAPLPLPPPRLGPALPPLPSSGPFENAMLGQQLPAPIPNEKSSSTEYYKDSQARQKLRTYLASPEKFDEALEFGFPSEPTTDTYSTTSVEPALQTDSDDFSFANSKDDDDDDDDEASTMSPRTPSLGYDGFGLAVTRHDSLNADIAQPFNQAQGKGVGIVRTLTPDINGREMTLRLTLTRPELRAPEEELYAFQRKQVSGVEIETTDPLALQTLSVCDDHTGARGAFAVTKPQVHGLKKVWNNLRWRQHH